MKKLAAVAVVCAVLIGCEPHHQRATIYSLGDRVLVYNHLEGTVHSIILFRNSTEYYVLLDTGQDVRFEERYLTPDVRKGK